MTPISIRAIVPDHGGEPRILDTDLAAGLGLRQPLNFRASIAANREELETHGEVFTRPVKTSHKGGRPGRAYLLNEAQALVMCALSRTERAANVRRILIQTFTLWREEASKPVHVREHRRQLPAKAQPRPMSREALEREYAAFFRAFRDQPEVLASWAVEHIEAQRAALAAFAGVRGFHAPR